MKLSENFYLREFTKSQTAERKGIKNIPNKNQIENLQELCENVLQPIRNEFGSFTPSSGFRCPELCIEIGSSSISQHAKGQAADFEVMGVDNKIVANWIINNLTYDQLILECYKPDEPNSGWIHVSYCSWKDEQNRMQSMTYEYKIGYKIVKGEF